MRRIHRPIVARPRVGVEGVGAGPIRQRTAPRDGRGGFPVAPPQPAPHPAAMTSQASQRTEVPTVRTVPRMAAQLRRVALHEETAALLEVRASRAGTEDLASPLQRR